VPLDGLLAVERRCHVSQMYWFYWSWQLFDLRCGYVSKLLLNVGLDIFGHFLVVFFVATPELFVLEAMQQFFISICRHLYFEFGTFLKLRKLLLELQQKFVLLLEFALEVEVLIEDEHEVASEKLDVNLQAMRVGLSASTVVEVLEVMYLSEQLADGGQHVPAEIFVH